MRASNSRLRRIRQDSRGATLVETAAIIPLLLLVTFGIVEFGGLFYAYLALENGVSQATRYAVTGNQLPNLSRDASVIAVMRQATPTLTIADNAFSFSHLSTGSSTWSSGSGQPGDIEKVTVDYDWQIITPLLRPFFPGGQFHIQVASAMKTESRFQ